MGETQRTAGRRPSGEPSPALAAATTILAHPPPALRCLNVMGLGVTGTFPTAWEHGGFPSLTLL